MMGAFVVRSRFDLLRECKMEFGIGAEEKKRLLDGMKVASCGDGG